MSRSNAFTEFAVARRISVAPRFANLAAYVVIAAIVALLLLPSAAAAVEPALAGPPSAPLTLAEAMRVQATHEPELLALKEVRGIGIGMLDDGRFALRILVDAGATAPRLPSELEGLPVVLVPVGRIVAQVQPGESTSNVSGCFSGTIGFPVTDATNPQLSG